MLDTEQISRLDAGHSAHSMIIDMIRKGATLDKIYQHCHSMKSASRKQLKFLLKSENTESVSDESGVLHGVRESLANDLTDNDSQSSVDGALEKITDSENNCQTCGSELSIIRGQNGKILAKLCDNCDWQE